ncbi:unnamed protein product [Phaeothamnion confervicola]
MPAAPPPAAAAASGSGGGSSGAAAADGGSGGQRSAPMCVSEEDDDDVFSKLPMAACLPNSSRTRIANSDGGDGSGAIAACGAKRHRVVDSDDDDEAFGGNGNSASTGGGAGVAVPILDLADQAEAGGLRAAAAENSEAADIPAETAAETAEVAAVATAAAAAAIVADTLAAPAVEPPQLADVPVITDVPLPRPRLDEAAAARQRQLAALLATISAHADAFSAADEVNGGGRVGLIADGGDHFFTTPAPAAPRWDVQVDPAALELLPGTTFGWTAGAHAEEAVRRLGTLVFQRALAARLEEWAPFLPQQEPLAGEEGAAGGGGGGSGGSGGGTSAVAICDGDKASLGVAVDLTTFGEGGAGGASTGSGDGMNSDSSVGRRQAAAGQSFRTVVVMSDSEEDLSYSADEATVPSAAASAAVIAACATADGTGSGSGGGNGSSSSNGGSSSGSGGGGGTAGWAAVAGNVLSRQVACLRGHCLSYCQADRLDYVISAARRLNFSRGRGADFKGTHRADPRDVAELMPLLVRLCAGETACAAAEPSWRRRRGGLTRHLVQVGAVDRAEDVAAIAGAYHHGAW